MTIPVLRSEFRINGVLEDMFGRPSIILESSVLMKPRFNFPQSHVPFPIEINFIHSGKLILYEIAFTPLTEVLFVMVVVYLLSSRLLNLLLMRRYTLSLFHLNMAKFSNQLSVSTILKENNILEISLLVQFSNRSCGLG